MNIQAHGWSESGCAYLSEEERLLIVDGVETIVWHHLGPILLSDRVGWEAIHVHFDVGANLPIG